MVYKMTINVLSVKVLLTDNIIIILIQDEI